MGNSTMTTMRQRIVVGWLNLYISSFTVRHSIKRLAASTNEVCLRPGYPGYRISSATAWTLTSVLMKSTVAYKQSLLETFENTSR